MESNDNIVLAKINELAIGFNLEIVEATLFHSKGQVCVRCLVDALSGERLNIDSCAGFNRAIGHYLEESNIFGENFSVEVNSPGLDRKLKTAKDFKRVVGRALMLWLNAKLEGKDYHEGILKDVCDNKLTFDVKGKDLVIDMALVVTGKENIAI